MAKRIQMRRTKGWRKPEGAVYVGRPTQWGNPFKVGDPGVPDARAAVDQFSAWLIPYRHGASLEDYLLSEANIRWVSELRGKDLLCWCPLDQPCHADILLEIANG